MEISVHFLWSNRRAGAGGEHRMPCGTWLQSQLSTLGSPGLQSSPGDWGELGLLAEHMWSQCCPGEPREEVS